MEKLKSYEQFIKENINIDVENEEVFENLITEEQLNEIFGLGDGLSTEAKNFAKWYINLLIYSKLGKKTSVPENIDEAKEIFQKYYERSGEIEINGTKRPKYVLKTCEDKKTRNEELTSLYELFKDYINKMDSTISKQQKGLGGPAL